MCRGNGAPWRSTGGGTCLGFSYRAKMASLGRTSQPTLLQQILGFEGNKYNPYISAKVIAFFKKYKIMKVI